MREAPDGGARYERKMRFLNGFARQLTRSRRDARARGRDLLLMGDLNIAHTRHDVRNWRRSNQVEGYLPEEREWFGSILSPAPSSMSSEIGARTPTGPTRGGRGWGSRSPTTPVGASTTTSRPPGSPGRPSRRAPTVNPPRTSG
ncbi:endonuclease/exonuclease/phosphatase family protein [Rhodococcus sp. MTM3W5.2]|uniref:endonuclease/exonuclease/phosphatase family protein n=1 Tax=Rhodococcus sp. MTM3W5.2 TaxID=1805827 RepID=UPI0039835EF4